MTDQENMKAAVPDAARRYMRYLLIMAGLGGLLYGVDVGVIAAALPYIEQTAGFNPSQLSQVVAAVLFGSVLSSLFAGYLGLRHSRPVPVFRFLPFERISPLPVPPRPQG